MISGWAVVLFAWTLGCGGDDNGDSSPDTDVIGGECAGLTPADGEACPCPGEILDLQQGDCFYACQCTESGWQCGLLRCSEDVTDADTGPIEGSLGIEGTPTVRLVDGDTQESYGPEDELEVTFTLVALDGEEPADVLIALSGNESVDLPETNISLDGVGEEGTEVRFTFRIRADAQSGAARVSLDAAALGYSSLTRAFTVDVVNTRPRLQVRGLRMVTPDGDFNSDALEDADPGARVDLMGEVGHTGTEPLAEVRLTFSTPNPGTLLFDETELTLDDLPPVGETGVTWTRFRLPTTISDTPGSFSPTVSIEATGGDQAVSATFEGTLSIAEPPPVQLVGEVAYDILQDSRTQCPGLFGLDISVFDDENYDPCGPDADPADTPFDCFCAEAAADCNLAANVGSATLTFRLRNNSASDINGVSLVFGSTSWFCDPSDTTPPCGESNAPDFCHDGPIVTPSTENPTSLEAGEEADFSATLQFTQATGLAFSLDFRVNDGGGQQLVRFEPRRYNRVPQAQ